MSKCNSAIFCLFLDWCVVVVVGGGGGGGDFSFLFSSFLFCCDW